MPIRSCQKMGIESRPRGRLFLRCGFHSAWVYGNRKMEGCVATRSSVEECGITLCLVSKHSRRIFVMGSCPSGDIHTSRLLHERRTKRKRLMQLGAARVPVSNCVGPHSSIVAIITSAPSEARLLRGVSFSFCREIASFYGPQTNRAFRSNPKQISNARPNRRSSSARSWRAYQCRITN
jgi:hypothetical protein